MTNPEAGQRAEPALTQGHATREAGGSECASVEDLSLDYVLATSDAAANEFVEDHSRSCPVCNELISSLQYTAGLLSFVSSAAVPSDDTKSKLLTRIQETPQDPVVPETVFAGSLDDLKTPTLPSSAEADSSPSYETAKRQSWWLRFSAPLLVVPVLVALGVVGYWGVNTHAELDNERATTDILNGQIQLLNDRVESLTGGMDGIETVLSQDSSKKYAMTAMPSAKSRDAYGLLVVNPQSQDAAILVWNLDPSRNVYEVMLGFPTGESIPISDLYVDANGDGMKRFDFDMELSNLSSIHIRPKAVETLTDSQLAAVQPDVLYGSIMAGLDQEADTAQGQQ